MRVQAVEQGLVSGWSPLIRGTPGGAWVVAALLVAGYVGQRVPSSATSNAAKIRPGVSRTYPFDEIARAQHDFLAKDYVCKPVLVPAANT